MPPSVTAARNSIRSGSVPPQAPIDNGPATSVTNPAAGNLYVATMNGVGIQVFNAAGTHLGNIAFTGRSNCCRFGGPDMKTMFVSARDGIYAVKTSIPGLKTTTASE